MWLPQLIVFRVFFFFWAHLGVAIGLIEMVGWLEAWIALKAPSVILLPLSLIFYVVVLLALALLVLTKRLTVIFAQDIWLNSS